MTAQGDGSVVSHANPGSVRGIGPGISFSIILSEILRGSVRGQRPLALGDAGGGARPHSATCNFG